MLFWSDNPFLTPETIEGMDKTLTGVWAERYKYAIWADPKGKIFLDYAEPQPAPPHADMHQYSLSVDPAPVSVTHALLYGQVNDVRWIIDEWVHDGNKEGELSEREQSERIKRWIDHKGISVRFGVCDSAAKNFRLTLQQTLKVPIYKSKKARGDNEGIQITAANLARRKLRFSDQVPKLLDEVMYFRWDENSIIAKPIKEHNHGVDAMIYREST